MTVYDKYEWVIGLEVHAQLNTRTKIFAADEASFGAAPNAHISPMQSSPQSIIDVREDPLRKVKN